MSFRIQWYWLALAAVLFAGAILVWPGAKGDLSCRHVTLIDSLSGAEIQGAEDMALAPGASAETPWLLLTAYNRRTNAPGGLYALAISELLKPTAQRLTVERLAPPPGAPPLKPHGFDLSVMPDGTVSLAQIEREVDVGLARQAIVRAYTLNNGRVVPAGAPLTDLRLCNANDIAIDSAGALYITTDRQACTRWGRLMEDILDLPRGRVFLAHQTRLTELAGRIPFANGIAVDQNHLYVAATRGHALLIYDRAAGADTVLPLPERLTMTGAPDNLAWGDDGALYIAAHGSLIRYALFQAGLRSDSESDILRYDPLAGRHGKLVRIGRVNRRGAVSGATVALSAKGRIVLGSAYDNGISVCGKPGAGTP